MPLGSTVGYKVRFTDKVSEDTRVALMTDGILLNEIHRDRLLRRYDTIIVDEAHERSLNVDFLHRLPHADPAEAPRPQGRSSRARRSTRESFAKHFADAGRQPGADHRGVGAHLPRRDPLPPAGERRQGRRPRPTTSTASPRPCASSTASRAGDVLVFLPGRGRDPRRGGCRSRHVREGCRAHRGAPPLRAAELGRAAPRVRAVDASRASAAA